MGISDPAAAICCAARNSDLEFLDEQPQAKLLLLYGNGDSVIMITHAVDLGNMLSLKILLRVPFCVHMLLNLPSKDGNYPLMAAVTKLIQTIVLNVLNGQSTDCPRGSNLSL